MLRKRECDTFPGKDLIMPHYLLSHEDWEVALTMNNEGQWFLQFTSRDSDIFTWRIDKESPEGSHFHNWIGFHYPEVIGEAMDKLW